MPPANTSRRSATLISGHASRSTIGLALAKPDDPERRIPSEERIRIVRDRYLRVEGREPTVREVQEMVDLNPASVGEWLRYLRGDTPHPAERRRRARRQVAA